MIYNQWLDIESLIIDVMLLEFYKVNKYPRSQFLKTLSFRPDVAKQRHKAARALLSRANRKPYRVIFEHFQTFHPVIVAVPSSTETSTRKVRR